MAGFVATDIHLKSESDRSYEAQPEITDDSNTLAIRTEAVSNTENVHKSTDQLITTGSHQSHEASQPTSAERTKAGIETLPRELIIEIADYLSPCRRASLAITSRRIHHFIGRALRLSPADRHSFLYALENDGVWISEILCQFCNKFHLPRQNRLWTMEKGSRPCISDGNPQIIAWSHPPSLPVTWDMVAAITRCQRHGSTQYSVDCLQRNRTFKNGDTRIEVNTSARVSRGHLILKTETILDPGGGHDYGRTIENVPKLRHLIEKRPKLARICGHAKWTDAYLLMFDTDAKMDGPTPPDQWPSFSRVPGDIDLSGRVLQECLWNHERMCWPRCDAASRLGPYLGSLWACGRCSTDYKVSTRHRTGGKVLVFTSWKDLGTGKDILRQPWVEHLGIQEIEEVIRVRSAVRFSLESRYNKGE
ncbi:hypothetical protein FZEAL_9042 [Fusarium zealandicum]|uniref:F-box domain-containing protein n=1 Tax=Fusarium zealandicum TaxID=1053134 RepID=A0A8H4UCP7_9HYPO|nr:hypothetical protein FZEAL_9042 [Fusarium zealandicum]